MLIKELAQHGYSFRGSSITVGGEWCCSLQKPIGSELNPQLFFHVDMNAAFEAARLVAIADFVKRRLS